jgi:hypothetical protein
MRLGEFSSLPPSSFRDLQTFQLSNLSTFPRANSLRIRTFREYAPKPFRMRSFKTKGLNPFRIRIYGKTGGRGSYC